VWLIVNNYVQDSKAKKILVNDGLEEKKNKGILGFFDEGSAFLQRMWVP
jgi:hypothetical protein